MKNDLLFHQGDASSQFGLLVIQEDKILFNEKQASERDKQNVALILAKNLAELVENKFFINSIIENNRFNFKLFD